MKPTDEARPEESPAIRSRPLLLAAAFFILGAILTATWFYYSRPATGAVAGRLSEATQNLLGQLDAPVTIRYFSLLPAGSANETLQSYAERVEQLLDAVQAATGGKVQVSRFNSPTETNITAASTEGIRPFNLDKGDACFLGLTIVGREHKESLPQLQPEWEAALEFDLARAILRAGATAAPAPLPAAVAKPSAETIATINRLIPDVKSVSEEEADQIFHAEFLKDCAIVGTELEAQINAAQEKVQQAATNGSADDLEAARKNLAKVQVEQADKLKQVAAQLQVRMALFKQQKSGAGNAGK
jgi:hypothetical protein